MSEPKPFASLSSGLLARKGAARPAMRPQGFGQSVAGLEDLGWNDMGFEAPKAASAPRDEEHDAFGEEIVDHPRSSHRSGLTPIESPVHGQQAEIAGRFAEANQAADQEEGEFDEDDDDFSEAVEADHSEPEADMEDEAAAPSAVEYPPVVAFKKVPVLFADPHVEEFAEPVFEVQVEALAQAVTAPRRLTRQRFAPGLKDKAAFTLRLDQARHLKLRLACAVHGRSAQMIVTDALDQLLTAMPELEAMAEKAKRKGF